LVAALDSHPDAGSVTGKVLQYHDRTIISAAGDIVTRDAVCASRGQGERDRGQYDLTEPVVSGTGAASVYRASAFKMVGVFDEDFFAYLEDVDWGLRAQLHGLSCWYIPEARAYHLRGATQRRVSGLLVYLLLRNTLWLATKNFPGCVLRRRFWRLSLLLTLRSYRGIRDGAGRPVAKAWLEAFSGLPKMLRKRAAIRAGRTLRDEEIEGLFSPGSLGSPRLRRLKDRVS
jgi:GT2 family glycosyltransferase